MKHYKSLEILSNFQYQASPAQTQSPPHELNAPLVKTSWRRFCGNHQVSFTSWRKH